MCGIAGIHCIHSSLPYSDETLKLMIRSIRHRGPDETGFYFDDRTALGHARLSIIDLGSGAQPIHNEDRTVWIIFNGEIFNYPELRRDLMSRGHVFATTSDTEVLVHLYEDKGVSMLDDINGQFSFVIWNSATKELFAARDRVGIRPFFYTVRDGKLIFASEIKALFTDESIPREIDPIALDQILTFWTTLNSRSIFKDIHELPPGHYLTVSNGTVAVRRYWDIPFCPEEDKLDWNEDRISGEIMSILTDSIRIRLRADVEVGAYLSGGLDSSGVTSIITGNFNNRVNTFGIRFEDAVFDEGAFQKTMVDYLNVDHKELVAGNKRIYQSLRDVIWHCEKPLVRTAPVPLYLLSDLVRNSGLKVVLTGEGADEVFGGYNIFRENKIRRFWARQPDSTFRYRLLERLYPYIFRDTRMTGMMKSFFGRGIGATDDPLYSHMPRWNNTARIKYYLSEQMTSRISDYNCFDEARELLPDSVRKMDVFSIAQYLEMKIFMSNYLLSSQGDRVAMAHSVEIRLPFLDHRLIEFMSRVPSKWKIKGLQEKYVLKKALQEVLPDSIVWRKKHPFRAPIEKEVLTGENLSLINSRIPDELSLFDREKVLWLTNRLQKMDSHSETDGMAIIAILTTHNLLDLFIRNFRRDYRSVSPPDVLIDKRR